MKGFAEMAVAKTSRDLAPPQPSPVHLHVPVPKPTIHVSPHLVVAGRHGSQVAPKSIPKIIVAEEETTKSATPTPVHIRAYSSPAPVPSHERSFSSPVDTMSSPGSDEAYYSPSSPSYSSVMEAEDFRGRSRPASTVLTRQTSRDSFLSDDSMFDDRHERSQSFTGPVRDRDDISVVSANSTASSKGVH